MFNKVNFTESLEKDLKDNPDLKKYAEIFSDKYELIKSLINIRKSLNLTKEQVAIRSEIPLEVVSRIESINNDVDLDLFLRYTNALGIKLHLGYLENKD